MSSPDADAVVLLPATGGFLVDIVITGRRTEVTERFRRQAEEKLVKVSQFNPGAHRIDVELSHERNPRQSSQCERVEITVRDKGPVIRAEACAEDPLAALDIAFGKLLERLRRMGDRKKVHHGRHAPVSVRGAGLLPTSEPAGHGVEVAATVAGGGIGLAVAERSALNGNQLNGDHVHDSDGTIRDGHLHDSQLPGSSRAGTAVADPAFDELADLADRGDLPEGAEDLADSPVVIRTKDHTATPMTIDQALYEMELVGHDFYLFVDAACGKPSVVYRRRGWNYGVIRLALAPVAQEEMARQS
jgi:ribosomal subunit interface protein